MSRKPALAARSRGARNPAHRAPERLRARRLPWRAPVVVVGHSCVASWAEAVREPFDAARLDRLSHRGERRVCTRRTGSWRRARRCSRRCERHYGPLPRTSVDLERPACADALLRLTRSRSSSPRASVGLPRTSKRCAAVAPRFRGRWSSPATAATPACGTSERCPERHRSLAGACVDLRAAGAVRPFGLLPRGGARRLRPRARRHPELSRNLGRRGGLRFARRPGGAARQHQRADCVAGAAAARAPTRREPAPCRSPPRAWPTTTQGSTDAPPCAPTNGGTPCAS